MKPFNLKEAKAGKPVCMRNGRAVRIICWDKAGDEYPIVALSQVPGSNAIDEEFYCYTPDGVYLTGADEQDCDLFMATITKTVWVNLYRDQKGGSQWTSDLAHITQAAAQAAVVAEWDLIGTFPITFED